MTWLLVYLAFGAGVLVGSEMENRTWVGTYCRVSWGAAVAVVAFWPVFIWRGLRS
jgi:hypothetical protein